MLTLAREMMPFFLRTRRLDIGRLERKPAENLEIIREVLYLSVRDVLDKLKKKEQMYYGFNKDATSEMSKWAASVTRVINVGYLTHLSGAWQLEYILARAADPKMKFDADIFDVNRTKECYRKLKDSLPHKFADLIEDIRAVLKYLKKYLLSFYDLDSEVTCLDTAATYERQRQQFTQQINQQIAYIHGLSEKFKSNVILSDMSVTTRELARKCDCIHLPLLFVFPETCETIRHICQLILGWLDADSNYASYITNDVKILKSQRESQEQELKDFHQKYHQLHFKFTRKENECSNIDAELEDLNERESDCIIDEELTMDKTNAMQVEIEMKEYRRDELNKIGNLHPDVLKEKYLLSEQIRELNMRLPGVMRQVLGFRNKILWIARKKEELHRSVEELKEFQHQTNLALEEKIMMEVDLQSTMEQLQIAKRILLYKTSSDAVTKLFHDHPVRMNRSRLPGKLEQEDPFERACQVVIQNLQMSWSDLYRSLPFHPKRGENLIDNDIAKLSQLEARTSVQETAEKCLNKWRRHHTRASLEDLKEGLGKVRRQDILEKIDLDLNPPQEVEVIEEDLYPYADPELIPYLKEVERFDELLKANKIE